MNSKVTITINVCDGQQDIRLYLDPENDNCIIMDCSEIDGSPKTFKTYLSKEEVLLLINQLKQFSDEKV